MSNQQAIHQWLTGFLEGEGCFSMHKRKRRGKTPGELIEFTFSYCNTDRKLFDLASTALKEIGVFPSICSEKRTNRLECFYGSASSLVVPIKMRKFLKFECDTRFEMLCQFCQSRLDRMRYSPSNQFELEIYDQFRKWRASETTREESYDFNPSWLASIIDTEGTCNIHSLTKQPSVMICNTNNRIIDKAYKGMLANGISGHLHQFFPKNPNHQSFWHLTVHGRSKVQRLWELVGTLMVSEKFKKIMI